MKARSTASQARREVAGAALVDDYRSASKENKCSELFLKIRVVLLEFEFKSYLIAARVTAVTGVTARVTSLKKTNKKNPKTLNNLLVFLSYYTQIIYKLHEIVSLFCTYNWRRTDQADNQQKKKLHLAPQTVSGPLIVRAACMPQERITVNSFIMNKILSLCSLPSSWSLRATPLAFKRLRCAHIALAL